LSEAFLIDVLKYLQKHFRKSTLSILLTPEQFLNQGNLEHKKATRRADWKPCIL